jgi:putative ABC transport system ATP-binding protein
VPELEIADLTVEYTSGGYAIRPIDGLDLRAHAGSLTLLLGPSGSGKTSLLSCLGGILTPKSGRIRFGDLDVTSLRGQAATRYRRNSVGIIFQAFNLVPSLTAMENVMVPLWASGVRRRRARDRAGALLEQVGLSDRAGHRPGALSGGQRQRVAVARALALDPPLVLADEPTAYLDYIQVEGILRLLRDVAGGDRLVVVATHDQRLLPLADRAVELVPHVSVSSRPPERVVLAPGEVLFRQGSWGDLIYVVEDGVVEIIVELADGDDELRSVVTAGEYFGEIGPVFAMPRSATARARSACVVIGYTAQDFRDRIGKGRMTVSSADVAATDGGATAVLAGREGGSPW